MIRDKISEFTVSGNVNMPSHDSNIYLFLFLVLERFCLNAQLNLVTMATLKPDHDKSGEEDAGQPGQSHQEPTLVLLFHDNDTFIRP